MLPVGGTLNLYGSPKSGKTYAALHMAACIAGGIPDWLGIPIETHGPVLYIMLDVGRALFLKNYVHRLRDAGYDLSNLYFWDRQMVPFPFNMLGEGGLFLKQHMLALDPKPIHVILDTMRDAHSGDENESSVMRNMTTTLTDAVLHNAWTGLSHSRKMSRDQVADLKSDNRGSSQVAGTVDCIMRIDPKETSANGTIVFQSRSVGETELKVYRHYDGFWMLPPKERCLEDRILDTLRIVKAEGGSKGLTGTELARDVMARKEDVLETIKKLDALGAVKKTDEGLWIVKV